MKKLIITLSLTIFILLGCSQSPVETPTNKLSIVATFPPLTSMTKNIVGDNAVVHNLIPAGSSIHTWEPNPSDVKKVSEADLIITNGLGLEEFLDDLLANSQSENISVVNTSLGIEAIDYEEDDDHHDDEHNHEGGQDPHIWLSLKNAQTQVRNISDAIISIDPANEATYIENSQEYIQLLINLDQQNKLILSDNQDQNFLLYHDAYQYFLRDYNLTDNFKGTVESFPGKEPSPAYLKELTEKIETESISTIFVEPQFSPKLVESLSLDYGITVKEIDPIGADISADGYVSNFKKTVEAFKSLSN